MVELLGERGELLGEPKPITHPVKFYEKGDRPLEIVTTRQWYIRNGGRDDPLREALVRRGGEIDWHPPYMQVRYDNWVGGLNGDWLISRQRFFGVPTGPCAYFSRPGATIRRSSRAGAGCADAEATRESDASAAARSFMPTSCRSEDSGRDAFE